MKKHVIITGGAGFIGSHLVQRLLDQQWKVTVIDNFDPFYDIEIKKANIKAHLNNPDFTLLEIDLRDYEQLKTQLTEEYDAIVHLAAKAGVRPSIKAPALYQSVNVLGTQNMLEIARRLNIKQFVFGSSSSVYGVNPNVPWSEDDYVLQPISPYASSKISAELLGHVYAHLYNIRFVALRFFTVFGPGQRPDLAIHKFAKMMLANEAIPVFGDGSSRRDYTFVDDIVAGIVAAIAYEDSIYEIINIGNNRTISLSQMIYTLEQSFNVKAKINRLPMQPGDVPKTYANISKAQTLLGYNPTTSFEEGIDKFKEWFFDVNYLLWKRA